MIFDSNEDAIIKLNMELSPFNIAQAARNAAQDIGSCTPKQVLNRWYSKLRYGTPVYTIQSKYVNVSNIKTIVANTRNITVLDKVEIQYIIPFKQ